MTRELAVTIEDIEKIEEKKEKAEETKGSKRLVLDMDELTMYFVKWEGARGGAPIPQMLAGKWTNKQRLERLLSTYMTQRDG